MEGGFYQQKRFNPKAVTIVVLLHGAALTALIMAKSDLGIRAEFGTTKIFDIKEPPPPKPEPVREPPKTPQEHRSVIDVVKPVIELPPRPTDPIDIAKVDLPPIDYSRPGSIDIPPPPPPPPPIPIREPVRTEARIDNGSALQPPYPASAQREGAEGLVQVRVAIGADGRVKAVEKVKASRDDFYVATERQALRYWRFKPATVDGRPTESSKVMTVHFELNDLG